MTNAASPSIAPDRSGPLRRDPGRDLRALRRRTLALVAGLVPLAAGLGWLLASMAPAPGAPEIAALLAGGICALGGGAVIRGLRAEYHPHHRLGPANTITLLRMAGIAALAGLAILPQDPAAGWTAGWTTGWTVAGVAAALLALDGVDGWAARRTGLASRFGARFDMETDVAFALVLALLAVQGEKAGAWFLLLGLLRPLYLAAARLWPVLRSPLPPSDRRRTAAGAQMAGQVALLAPVLAAPYSALLALALLAGMALSFAVDIRWQIRQGRAAP